MNELTYSLLTVTGSLPYRLPEAWTELGVGTGVLRPEGPKIEAEDRELGRGS